MTTDAKILSALRANPDGVSGAQLAEQLAISRAAVWARMDDLRKAGYDIAASPHFGYRLVSAPDALHADDLLARLGKTKIVGRDIRVFEETSSTNDVAEKLARVGESHLRPSRPRPLVCDSAKTTTPSRTPSRASFSATSLVELVS